MLLGAHAIKINFENNRYTTPITTEFSTNTKYITINESTKHREIPNVIKVFDPSTVILAKTKKDLTK